MTLNKPTPQSSIKEIKEYCRSWVRYAAQHGLDAALAQIDDNPNVKWSAELFDELSYNHFDDNEHCIISNPDEHSDLDIDVYQYDDEIGFAVDHDLALNNKRSDLTAQFSITFVDNVAKVILEDIHVM